MTPKIVLKFNNIAVNEPCAICGGRSDAGIGIELFAEGAGLICEPCANEYAQELKRARDILAEESNFKRLYPDMFASEPARVNVCQHCGSEKDLRPFKRLGSVYHVCRDCQIKQVKAQAQGGK